MGGGGARFGEVATAVAKDDLAFGSDSDFPTPFVWTAGAVVAAASTLGVGSAGSSLTTADFGASAFAAGVAFASFFSVTFASSPGFFDVVVSLALNRSKAACFIFSPASTEGVAGAAAAGAAGAGAGVVDFFLEVVRSSGFPSLSCGSKTSLC